MRFATARPAPKAPPRPARTHPWQTSCLTLSHAQRAAADQRTRLSDAVQADKVAADEEDASPDLAGERVALDRTVTTANRRTERDYEHE